MPEAADNNAPALALLTDLAWTPGTVGLDDWFAAYALSRYGGPDRHAARPGRRSATPRTTCPARTAGARHPTACSGARPSLNANKAAGWGPEQDRYDTTAFDAALNSSPSERS
jgi:alpha-N-acetylglucosaminidase